MMELGELGEVSFRMLKLGELGEASHRLLELGELDIRIRVSDC